MYFHVKPENYLSSSVGSRDYADLSNTQGLINTWIEESAGEAWELQCVILMLRKMIS